MQNYKITNKDLDEHGHLIKEYPYEIFGEFNCINTNISSLKGVPQIVNDDFFCSSTKIISLEYSPQIVRGLVHCANNNIPSLEGIGKRYLKEISSMMILSKSDIKSNMLGLMLVKGLTEIIFSNNRQLEDIFNKHLDADRDILECQEELRAMGFKQYAKL